MDNSFVCYVKVIISFIVINGIECWRSRCNVDAICERTQSVDLQQRCFFLITIINDMKYLQLIKMSLKKA